jgi:cobalt/nickel transport system ATP-binding protein
VIAMEPEVLVLDEPTAGLDPRGVADLNKFINTLSSKYGMTVIFSTHDVGLVPEIADYIYVMDKGRIVASGTVDEIFVQPEMLQSVRLDVPVIPRLLSSLKKSGIEVSMAYTYAEAEESLLRAFGKRS